MTTPNLQEIFTVTLGEHELKMTPTLGMLRHLGSVEEQLELKDDEAVDGNTLLGILYSSISAGTKRHHEWQDILWILEDCTFLELMAAVRDGMMARLGEVREAQSKSP